MRFFVFYIWREVIWCGCPVLIMGAKGVRSLLDVFGHVSVLCCVLAFWGLLQSCGNALAQDAMWFEAGELSSPSVKAWKLPDGHPLVRDLFRESVTVGGDSDDGYREGLESLFADLRNADDAEQAESVAAHIRYIFLNSGSPTLDLLMMRSAQAMKAEDYALSLDLLDAVVRFAPQYVEGWNRRATVHFLREDYGLAMADLEQVLRLEPRHFSAVSGLGLILQKLGRKEQALDVFQHVLSIYPLLEEARDAVRSLRSELRGQYH